MSSLFSPCTCFPVLPSLCLSNKLKKAKQNVEIKSVVSNQAAALLSTSRRVQVKIFLFIFETTGEAKTSEDFEVCETEMKKQ